MPHPLDDLVLAVTDPRDTKRVTYPLNEILFQSITAVICGANGPSEIAVFGEYCLEWLRQYYPFKQGAPSHDTINRTLSLIGIRQFESVFFNWVSRHFNVTDQLQVAIDGKKISRSAKKAAQQLKKSQGGEFAELIVNAYVPGLCVTLAQANEGESQSEVAGARKLLAMLDLEGVCVSADAGFLGKGLLAEITAKKGDYLVTLKGKSPVVFDAVERAFAAHDKQAASAPIVQQETGHGRKSERRFTVLSINEVADEKARMFYSNCQQIVRVERLHQPKGKEAKKSTHYYITSLRDDLLRLQQVIRSHWSVENQLHHTLDVIFREDALVAQVNNLSNNLSLIRKVALNLLTAHHGTVGTKKRRMVAGLNESERNKLIKPLMR